MQVSTVVGNLYVADQGRPGGPPVLLWPSLYCDGSVFDQQAQALADQHRVLVLDPPGHRNSGMPPSRFSLEETAQASFQVLDALGIGSAAIVGGAWGGMVGVQMAALDPSRVSRLVLINSPLDRWRGRNLVAMTSLYLLLKIAGPRVSSRLVMSKMVSRSTRKDRPELVDQLRRAMGSLDHSSLTRSARSAMLDRPSLLPVLSGLSVPVLVLTGSDDAFVPVALARTQAEMIPGQIFDGTAHLSAYEAPDHVNEMLIRFLAGAS